MIKIKRLEIGKIKRIFQRLPRILGKRAFLTFLALLLLSLLLAGLCFYKYGFLAERAQLQIPQKSLQFEENVYSRVLQEWEARKKRLEESDVKKYPDPFQEFFVEGLTE